MPAFDVIWTKRKLQWSKRSETAPWTVDCHLLERKLIGGQPRWQISAQLGSIMEDKQTEVGERDRFWSTAQRKLGKLRRLTPRDVWSIETLIAAKIPKPVPVYPVTVGPSANPITGPHTTNLPRAVRTRAPRAC